MGPIEGEFHRRHMERKLRLFPPSQIEECEAPPPPQEPPPEIIDVPNFLPIRSEPPRITTRYIQHVVAQYYGITVLDIISERRTKNVVCPRQVAMYLAKTLTLRSLPEIGRRFGGRDHTTALHGVRKISSLLEIDQELADDIALLRKQLEASATTIY